MNKIILSLVILLSTCLAYAQPLSEGKNYFYYQRYQSAQSVFEKNIKDDAKNAEAWYWLALSQLESGKPAEAKATIKTGMEKTNNDPLLKIAMGHSFILENNKAEARSSFNAALSSPATSGKAILQVAIGRACAAGSLTQGDPDFGIEVLKAAAETDTKNPELYVLMGRCQLKLGGEHGSEGWGSYNKALQIDPSYADAYYRIGLIFQSQNNVDLMRENYDKAIQADPKFAPVYLSYFNYYAQRDVALAQKNLALYIKYADQDCSSSLYQAEYSTRTGNYKESIDILKQIEQDVCKNEPRVKVLYAYNYNATGDIDAARSSIESFFSTAGADKINANDYKLAGDIMAKIPGQENKAGDYYQKFIDKDTVKSAKLSVMQTAAALFEKSKNYAKAAEWYQKILNSKETPNNIDYFNCGIAYYGAANYAVLHWNF